MDTTSSIILGIVAFLIGGLTYFLVSLILRKRAQKTIRQLLDEAKVESERVKKEAQIGAKDEVYRLKEDFNKETQDARNELKQMEKRLLKREDALDSKVESIQRRERYIENLEKSAEQKYKELEAKTKEMENLINEEKKNLYNISGLNKEEATKLLLNRLETELATEKASLIQKTQNTAKEMAESEAKKIVALAIQRCAVDHTAPSVVATIDLPNEEMKGRVIGREGRNIRAFEKATGVDVIVDDTPGVIVVSAFDSVRREIARRVMEKLVLDGRIHPGRIEEMVETARKELDEQIQQTGKQTCYELNIHNINPKIVSLLGRLKYRTSYGQNVLQHSIEVAYLSAAIAADLGLDPVLAKRCGLLHDIGKAIDQEEEGTHPSLGAELARRSEERAEVIDAIEKHHETINPDFLYTVIVSAADAISAARPGARRETVEKYIKRLERLESIAGAYEGVENAYAIQAGREIRVIVNASKVDDNQAAITSRNIANDIEKELKYPGEIKVTVIRETRAIEYAR